MDILNEQDRAQVERVVEALKIVLGDALLGVYLFGSSGLGGMRPGSDIDLMVVVRRRMTDREKRDLIAKLLALSRNPRHLEVTVVVEADVSPWQFPPRMDFQYGDWWRSEFESGQLEPWDSPVNSDLASLVRMVLLADVALVGAPANEVFDPVPRADYVRSLVAAIDEVLPGIEDGSDVRNGILTLARIWNSIETDDVLSKDAAAKWVVPRLSEKEGRAIEEARDLYLRGEYEGTEGFKARARDCAVIMVSEIRALLAGGLSRPG